MKEKKKLGLALSGGGYRAAIYHLGTLIKLKELGILNKIDVISSNSGGSITAACYSLYHENFEEFEQKLKTGIKKGIISRVLISPRFLVPLGLFIALFTSRSWIPYNLPSFVFSLVNFLGIIVLILFQFKLFPFSKIIERKYNRIFFNGKKLKDLSNSFKTTINSTNIETGRDFYFSKDTMSDSYYKCEKGILFENKDFPVARAVMASSCVPFAFTPVRIKKKYFTNEKDYYKVKPKLVDGRVYDNQGIHKLTFLTSSSYCENVIVSDAGNFISVDKWSFNILFLLIRISSVFMTRIKNFQMMTNLYSKHTNSIVAYQSLGFDLESSIDEFIKMLKNGYIRDEVVDAHNFDKNLIQNKEWKSIKEHLIKSIDFYQILKLGCSENELKIARKVKTGLSALSEKKISALIKHAEAITEMQVKLFLPQILK